MNAQAAKNCDAGIYKTAEDLKNRRVTHKVHTGEKGYDFGFLFPADMKLTIKIVRPDTTLEFKPGTVFGYEECKRQFRYYKGGDLLSPEDFYRVEETAGLVIYSSVHNSGSELFYSEGIEAPIRRLDYGNVEEDFKDRPDFLAAVKELKKKSNDGITDNDGKGHFAINRLYAEKIVGKKGG
jgi:hypothetical protein